MLRKRVRAAGELSNRSAPYGLGPGPPAIEVRGQAALINKASGSQGAALANEDDTPVKDMSFGSRAAREYLS